MTGSRGKIRVGVSSCLLGERVRFDAGHKRDPYIDETLCRHFEFVPVCPEVAIGLGVPREPIRLVKDGGTTRVLGVANPDRDVTEALYRLGREKGRELTDISGYIFKRGSPSCGMERVKVYGRQGMPVGREPGMYARAFMEEQPLLPVEEEGRLRDPALRESFLGRVFVYRRWQEMLEAGLTPARLVDFHTAHKLTVLAHNQAAYRRMGRLVARAGTGELGRLAAEYVRELMSALKRPANRRNHSNAMEHLLGYLKKKIDAADRAELIEAIESYRCGIAPLAVPMTLLRHHFRRHPDRCVARQHYLAPYPAELMLL